MSFLCIGIVFAFQFNYFSSLLASLHLCVLTDVFFLLRKPPNSLPGQPQHMLCLSDNSFFLMKVLCLPSARQRENRFTVHSLLSLSLFPHKHNCTRTHTQTHTSVVSKVVISFPEVKAHTFEVMEVRKSTREADIKQR